MSTKIFTLIYVAIYTDAVLVSMQPLSIWEYELTKEYSKIHYYRIVTSLDFSIDIAQTF